MVSKKNQSVETLRGFAIILVVMGHVIGSGSDGGMMVANDSFWRHLYFTFEYLRMPLFTVISGWVYTLRPASLEILRSFNFKKIRRILFPMIFVGMAYFIIQYIVPGTNMKGNLNEMWKILIFPYTLYWYLPSLFIIFVVVASIDSFELINGFESWIILLILAFSLMIFRDRIIPESSPNIFSYKGAIYLFPFFLIGVGIQRFRNFFENKTLNFILLMAFITGIFLQQLGWYQIVDVATDKKGFIGLLVGVTGTILFFRLKWNVRILVFFGSYAYSIYLFHSFGTAGGRIIIRATGITNMTIIFVVSLFVGLFIPILAELALDKFKLTRLLYLGRSFHKNKKTPQSD